MPEAIILAERIANLSFPILVILVGIGHYRETWLWGKHHRKREKELLAQIEELKTDRDEWKRTTLIAAKISETSVAALLEDTRRSRL